MNKKHLTIIISIAIVLSIIGAFLIPWGAVAIAFHELKSTAPFSSQPFHWDMTALDDWCGQPEGAIRVIGAFRVDDNTLETEDGHQWNFEDVTFEDGLYIMWIDNNNTFNDVTDDLPIHIWKEVMF